MSDVIQALLILCAILIVIENLLVCLLVVFNKYLRSYTNGMIVSLSVSDILVGAVFLPSYVNNPFLEMNGYLTSIILHISVWTLCSVTTERWLAIKRPLEYRSRIPKWFYKMIMISWGLPVPVALVPMAWDADLSETAHKVYLVTTLVLGVIVPYCWIICAYCCIFHQVKNRRFQANKVIKNRGGEIGIRIEKSRLSAEWRVAKVFGLVAGLFSAVWIPVMYMTFCVVTSRYDLIPDWLPITSVFTLSTNSLINPMIYAFLKLDFRKTLLRMLHCKSTGQDMRVSSTRTTSRTTVRSSIGSVTSTATINSIQMRQLSLRE